RRVRLAAQRARGLRRRADRLARGRRPRGRRAGDGATARREAAPPEGGFTMAGDANGTVIDADGHVLEPRGMWQRYLDPKLAELILVPDPATGARVLPAEHSPQATHPHPISGTVGRLLGLAGSVGRRADDVLTGQIGYEDAPAGAFDGAARLKDMDTDGIEVAVPVGFHPLAMWDMPGATLGFDFPDISYAAAAGFPIDSMVTLTHLVFSGVLERFRDLQVIVLESSGGWIQSWLERLDHHMRLLPSLRAGVKRGALEQFHDQVWVSFDPDEKTLPAMVQLLGDDRF